MPFRTPTIPKTAFSRIGEEIRGRDPVLHPVDGNASKKMKRWLILSMCLLAVSGCSREEKPSQAKVPPQEQFLIGLIPELNIFKQLERYEPMAGYLSGKTGLGAPLKIFPRYGNIIGNFRLAGMGGGFFGSFAYPPRPAQRGWEV